MSTIMMTLMNMKIRMIMMMRGDDDDQNKDDDNNCKDDDENGDAADITWEPCPPYPPSPQAQNHLPKAKARRCSTPGKRKYIIKQLQNINKHVMILDFHQLKRKYSNDKR